MNKFNINRFNRRALLLACAASGLAACSGSSEPSATTASPTPAPIPKGSRLLGIGITDGSIGFNAAFAQARSAGLQFVTLAQSWDDIEKSAGVFSNTFLDIANAFYPANNTRVVLEFNPIDTNVVRLPADIRALAFDDPVVIERYKAAIDYVLSRLPNVTLAGIVIGNEIDATLGSDVTRWTQYRNFFQAAAAHVRTRKPGVPVGTKAQFGALGAHLTAINAFADAWMLTYYPVQPNFMVRDPNVVQVEFDAMVQAAQGKPVFLLETGYPSSATNGSSPDQQAQFIRAIFAAWDVYAAQIPMINVLWLHDIPTAELNTLLAYYGSSNPAFAAYLGSLGLRTYNAVNKPAYDALRSAAAARGW